MKRRAQVSKIMTADPVTVNLTNDVNDVVAIFDQKNIRHIPVVSGKDLIGIISKTDIDKVSFVTDTQNEKANVQVYSGLTLDQIMTKQVDKVEADEEIREVAKMLATGAYHALPVTDNGELAGIVTTTDVINYLLEQY